MICFAGKAIDNALQQLFEARSLNPRQSLSAIPR
jgi:hypothetical protein